MERRETLEAQLESIHDAGVADGGDASPLQQQLEVGRQRQEELQSELSNARRDVTEAMEELG